MIKEKGKPQEEPVTKSNAAESSSSVLGGLIQKSMFPRHYAESLHLGVPAKRTAQSSHLLINMTGPLSVVHKMVQQ